MATQPQGQVLPPEDDEEVVASESSLSIHEEADRSHQVSTARKYPRSITKFRKDMIAIAIASQPIAMEMMYSLPRAGKQLIGPSIRFAEALVTCWGNARVGVEVVEVDRKDAVVVAEGRFYDCEQNVGFAIRTRRRNVMTKKDDDSYQVTGNAASSIALRNAILRGIPKALWADIFEMAKATAAGGAASMVQIKEELTKFFTALGITEARLLATLDIPGLPDMGPDEIVAMKAWRKQLQQKETTLEDIFGSPDDDEIEWLTSALGWTETAKRMSKQGFSSRTEHLAHVRAEAAKANIVYSSAKAVQPKTKAGPQEVKKEQVDPTTSTATAESSPTPSTASDANPFNKTPSPEAGQQTASPSDEDPADKW